MTAIAELLRREARRMPQREALIFGDRTTNYAEFDANVDRHAAALSALGVAKGERLALLAPNSDSYLLAFFAGLRLGAIIVPINTRLAAPEVAHILDDCGARVLVFDADLGGLARESSALVAVDPPDMVGLRAAGDVPNLDALAAGAPAGWEPPEVHEGDDALILYTSGTTGHPKGVLLDHRRAIWAVRDRDARPQGRRALPPPRAVLPLGRRDLRHHVDDARRDARHPPELHSTHAPGCNRAPPMHLLPRSAHDVPDAAP
jgi:fatty-acyl-CoA synthase